MTALPTTVPAPSPDRHARDAFEAHHGHECKAYSRADWRAQVANDGTGANYWDWAYDTAQSEDRLSQLMPNGYVPLDWTLDVPIEAYKSPFEKDLAIFAAHYDHYECPQYPREDWLYQVENKDTLRGYWDWAYSSAESDERLDALMPGGQACEEEPEDAPS